MEAKIRNIGNSLGIILPKELTDALHLRSGDKLTIVKKGNTIEISQQDTDFAEWAEAYRELNASYKDVLTELAK
ncbi:MAG: toxin-antitoxin system MazE family antidote component [Bacteroidetes bacterium HLUCCA01]|nr:MAG: toxin-antitoxin system MazE family antidote component [Bacteroidetes bacterium HLUCCA01]